MMERKKKEVAKAYEEVTVENFIKNQGSLREILTKEKE